ncbi:hypothetical protein [Chitinophaga rhizosphaerae]|uniref:hypothetical protein n=1 Tax=Chitinophaga rhizosphaerae TaxID=1864947 RepID=UPI000F7FDD0D|nr:hypothetical protein [Chitinophaga rhizosphaerae]
MRLTAKTVALNFLRPGYPRDLAVSERTPASDLAFTYFEHSFPGLISKFRESVQMITLPFLEAFERAVPKLIEHLAGQSHRECGTMILPAREGSTLTIFYDLSITDAGAARIDITGDAFGFHTGPFPGPRYSLFLSRRKGQGLAFSPDGATSNDSVLAVIHRVVLLRQFLKLCEVETKFVEPGRKSHVEGQKYRNETPVPVELISCTWFTNIVRTAGFSVGADTGGFFRLQHFGPGHSKSRFIWIKPYRKNGYTIRARVTKSPNVGSG